jgi:EAL domain-containing protein (putative c-di-GMP-specific phosphodiesterase class I)
MLLRNADLAMYWAKSRGRARVEVYNAGMYAAMRERRDLETLLRRAIEQDELVVHYQPSYDLASGRIEGVEALLRWHHPGRGLVAPLEFVPLAEETGAMVSIGRWVLREACAQAARLNAQHPREHYLTMSVNVSARQLLDPRLPHDVAAALQAASLPPAALVLEIPETVLMSRDLAVFAALESLRRLGVRIAVDDFGTGYSSLGYLRRLPVDRLKIDRSFVRGVDGDRADVAVVEGLVGLAHGLGIELVAEGIERPTQLEALRRLHCEVGQGFSLARPLPVDELELLLAAEGSAPAPRLRLVSGEGR